jgi:hypothetical protein
MVLCSTSSTMGDSQAHSGLFPLRRLELELLRPEEAVAQ